MLYEVITDQGFKSYLSCVDGEKLGQSYAGRLIDESLLEDLLADVDPCGENGEFHTFVYNGPIFYDKVYFKKGALTLKDNRFYSCNLLVDKRIPTKNGL